jgi:putative phosphoribosyl transferase
LAEALACYKEQRPVILALPRGGVAVAREVATALKAPLDLIIVRKIGVPSQPELAMGAVVDGETPIVVHNEDVIKRAGIDEAEFNAICDCELAEIERRRQCYLGGCQLADVTGHTAIVIDDGIATGATIRAALRAVRVRNPKRLVLAAPVAPADTINELRREADDIICLQDLGFFGAIGSCYEDFNQISDEEVINMLKQLSARRPKGTA